MAPPAEASKEGGHLEEKRRVSPPPAREREEGTSLSVPQQNNTGQDILGTQNRVSRTQAPPKISCEFSSVAALETPTLRHPTLPRSADNILQKPAHPGRSHRCPGSLEVGLEDLEAPGGAFLRVPSSSTEPTFLQHTWLTWQLAHARAALHWALDIVSSILAAQLWLPRYAWLHAYSSMALGHCPPPLLPSPLLSLPKTQAKGPRDQATLSCISKYLPG